MDPINSTLPIDSPSVAQTRDVTRHQPAVFPLFWRTKTRIATNMLRRIKSHYYVHIISGLITVVILLLSLLTGFSVIFHWLLLPEQQPYGGPMLKRLMGMVLLAFFSMLTFSNLIIMLTTSYISREVEFYMSQPMSHRQLFFCKFSESTLYSSWAFMILSMPFFLALAGAGASLPIAEGSVVGTLLKTDWGLISVIPVAPWYFYIALLFLLFPFIVIPASLGAIIAMLITTYFPVKRMIRLAVVLALLGIGVAIFSGHMSARRVHLPGGFTGDIGRVMSFMGIGDVPWMPSTWLSRGIRAALVGDWRELFFWDGMLISSALMGLQVCHWLAGPLYFRGFNLSRSSGTSNRTREGGLFKFFDWLVGSIRGISKPVHALVVKDLTVFWRDPAQWGQLMVLFGLLFIYTANLGNAAELANFQIKAAVFRILIALFNIGSTCFILAILTTRFIYPMLSLEGKQQWVIGLAPFPRTRLVWVKFGLCWCASLTLTIPLILFSCIMLKTDTFITLFSLLTIILMSMGLNSLAIGLGALMPNFNEDNPARIANGLGGTINIITSMFYVGISVVLEFPIIGTHMSGSTPEGFWKFFYYFLFVLLAAVHGITAVVPLRLGLKNWQRLEF